MARTSTQLLTKFLQLRQVMGMAAHTELAGRAPDGFEHTDEVEKFVAKLADGGVRSIAHVTGHHLIGGVEESKRIIHHRIQLPLHRVHEHGAVNALWARCRVLLAARAPPSQVGLPVATLAAVRQRAQARYQTTRVLGNVSPTAEQPFPIIARDECCQVHTMPPQGEGLSTAVQRRPAFGQRAHGLGAHP